MLRVIRWAALGLALLLLLLLTTFAMPIRVWQTGELPVPPLSVIERGPAVELSTRVWVDTDAACGLGRRSDPDDCLALLFLARSGQVQIAGVSTVFGNAALDDTDRLTRSLAAELEATGHVQIPVFRGSANDAADPAPAHAALAEALERGPLTLVALGPLTNIAAALRKRPDLAPRVTRLVAVMGRRPGHLFHPAEGGGGGILFGHGPVFRDLNFDLDGEAAREVLGMGVPITFVPYEAAREVMLTAGDLSVMESAGGASRWVADSSRAWLDFWKSDIGLDGFYPFDLLAAQYVVGPALFDCGRAKAKVAKDRRLWNLWFHDPDSLLIRRPENEGTEVVYCPATDGTLHRRLMHGLAQDLHSALRPPPAG
jgi:inosine-uridine nucleoside N-ribohydrolase